MPVTDDTRHLLRKRAESHCEYCKRSDAIAGREFEVDHIKPQAQGGTDALDNLAYACHDCNQFKSDREQYVDPTTEKLVPLFNPRTQIWQDHFEWIEDKTILVGLSPEARATIACLKLNTVMLQEARKIWRIFGWPPQQFPSRPKYNNMLQYPYQNMGNSRCHTKFPGTIQVPCLLNYSVMLALLIFQPSPTKVLPW